MRKSRQQHKVTSPPAASKESELPTSIIPIAASVRPSAISVPCPCGSGKLFSDCHGLASAPSIAPLSFAPSTRMVRLDLGAGTNPRQGFESVDLHADANHKVDLFKFPFPADKWADDSVDEIFCSHFAEHIPAREIRLEDLSVDNPMTRERFLGQDMFLAFFDECYRILKDGATMTVVVPSHRSDRAFWDPTHRRFIAQQTFLYLNEEWRKVNRPGVARCNFGVNVTHSMMSDLNALAPEVFQRRFNEGWNIAIDWHAALVAQKKKPEPEKKTDNNGPPAPEAKK